MPLLQAEFEQFPKQMLFGETAKVAMRLTNAGQTSLHNLALKLSHPTFFVFPRASAGGNTTVNASIPAAALSTGNKMKKEDGLDSSVNDLLFIPGLAPGASLVFPVWLRAATPGSISFRFLFYYEPEAKEVRNEDSMQYRLCRLYAPLQVKPSLVARAVVKTSQRDLSSYLLALDLHNAHESLTFQLGQLASTSSACFLYPVPSISQFQTAPVSIEHLQSKTVFFRLHLNPSCVERNAPKMLLSEGVPALAFILLEREALEKEKAKERALVRGQPNSSPELARESIQNEKASDTRLSQIDLLLFWQTESGSRGQHHILSLALPIGVWRPAEYPMPTFANLSVREMPLPTTLDDSEMNALAASWLRYVVHFPRHLVHSFSSNRICTARVRIRAKNYHNQPMDVRLEMLKPVNAKRGQQKPGYLWAGVTQHNARINSEEEVEFITEACFYGPGTYNLARFQFILSCSAFPRPLCTSSTLQYLITISENS
jgi:hypothetical protein